MIRTRWEAFSKWIKPQHIAAKVHSCTFKGGLELLCSCRTSTWKTSSQLDQRMKFAIPVQSSSILLPNSPSKISSEGGPRWVRTWHISISHPKYTLKDTRLTPLGFSTEEYPHPPSHNLQNLHHKYSTFQVVEVI